jgi:XTP/dITP diphosphohydrolase
MELIFATHNKDKLLEAKTKIGEKFNIISLSDLEFFEEIEETSNTLLGNAKIKAETIYKKFNKNVFSDDTGLEVETLDNKPGVYSSRYAGENATYKDNVLKLLKDLQNKENRNARFRTVIYLILDGKSYFFEGEVKGQIIKEIRGEGGFGYDPIFLPDGYSKTFAELPLSEKNKISHRGKTLEKLSNFLNSL